eukprot:2380380-Prymnesium_polylepis.2
MVNSRGELREGGAGRGGAGREEGCFRTRIVLRAMRYRVGAMVMLVLCSHAKVGCCPGVALCAGRIPSHARGVGRGASLWHRACVGMVPEMEL